MKGQKHLDVFVEDLSEYYMYYVLYENSMKLNFISL